MEDIMKDQSDQKQEKWLRKVGKQRESAEKNEEE